MKIKMLRDIDTSSAISVAGELVVSDKKTTKKYRLSEKWFYEFLSAMEETEHKGTFGTPSSFWEHHYFGHSCYRPRKGKEKEAEVLFYKFKKNSEIKAITKFVIFIVFLTVLMLLVL